MTELLSPWEFESGVEKYIDLVADSNCAVAKTWNKIHLFSFFSLLRYDFQDKACSVTILDYFSICVYIIYKALFMSSENDLVDLYSCVGQFFSY